MAKRPSHTLLLLCSERIVRVDLGPGPGFGVMAERQTTGGTDDPGHLVAGALALARPVGKQVWVLWEGAWTQTVDLTAAVVSGLSPEDLAKSLSFEIEPLSAIPAGQSALGAAAAGSPV